MGELLLGVDIGTYSSKGVLVQPDGKVLASKIVQHSMDIPQPGWAELDADTVWWGDFSSICRSLLDGQPYCGEDVAAVAVSAIGPCMLPLDADGKPLRPGILYGVDTRAGKQIEELNRRIGEDTIYKYTDMALSSQAIGPKICWMKENEPDLWKQVAHITTASSYLIYKLTGEKVIDRHTASHYMPLMDGKTMQWSQKYAGDIIEIDKLPRLGWSDEIAGYVSPGGAAASGLKAGTPVAVGAVDALSEAISVGVVRPGDLMIMYGSTAFFILVQQKKTPDPSMWSVSGAFEGQFNLAAGMATTGSITRWFRDELARDLGEVDAYTALFATAARVPAGANGLIMLPYFSGERTPINDPAARGVIAGLSLSHTREDIFRAVLESVAYGIRHNLETFRQIGGNIRRIVAVGGGTKSNIWLQIVSDVCGVAQEVPATTIGASYGDAFLAGLAAGILKRDDLDTWVKPGQTIQPDAAMQSLYQSYYEQYLALYKQTRDIVHQIQKG